ncbi:MAG TPA: hypothetical protein VN902_00595 [Candidatus Acidoferrales bacterium]|jgi:hypothetical protein|nr:hypothetical protein [Candidatus Acidoferrales bacterium]
MIALLLYLLVGVGLLVFLWLLARRKGAPVEGCGRQFVEARQALRTLQEGLLPDNLIQRIFDRDDFRYVMASSPADIAELFLQERRRISLMWVRRVRCEVRNLMQFHLDYSRLHAKLSLLTEIRLGLDFAVLLLACRALRILLYLRGPYGARAVVGVMTAAAGRVCAASEKSLAFLNPPALGSFRRDSAGDGAAI